MQNTILYYNVVSGALYDNLGNILSSKAMNIFLNNHSNLELHYVTSYSSSTLPSAWDKFTKFAGIPIASTLSVDDNMKHAAKGVLASAITNTSTTAVVTSEEMIINPSGTLTFYKTDGTPVAIQYTAYSYTAGKYTFAITNNLGATDSFAVGSTVRIPEALMLSVSGSDVDDSRAGEGIFVFSIYALSTKLLALLDYSDISEKTAMMQHKLVSEGEVVGTFNFEYTVYNLLDYQSEASVPNTPDNPIADKTWVLSLFRNRVLVQFSSDQTNWHDTQVSGDKYLRVKLDEAGTLWSASIKLPDGAKGDPGTTPSIGANGNWYLGAVDTGVLARGIDGTSVLAQYSPNGASDWHNPPAVAADSYIRFSTDNGTSWSASQKYIGTNAPAVVQQFSPSGGTGTWHSPPFIATDKFTRFSVDGGATFTGTMRAVPDNVIYMYGSTATDTFHADFVSATDKWMKISVNGGSTYGTAMKFIGDDGKSFTPSKTGSYVDRSTYDSQPEGFSFLVTTGETNVGKLYFRVGATAGSWSDGLSFIPPGTTYQYSADGSSWRTTPAIDGSDKYMRQSVDGGLTWSSPMLFKGTSAYVYIGYALDANGTDFSLDPVTTGGEVRDFWNWINTDTEIPTAQLTLSKFNELGTGWFDRVGDDGVSASIFSGTTAPLSAQGVDGDWFINTSSGDMYQKVSGAWVLQLNIVGATGAGVTLKGAWNSSSSYQKDDGVTFSGSFCIAKIDNTNVEPPILPVTENSAWVIYVGKGDKGDPGQPLAGNYVEVSSVTGGYIIVDDATIPTTLETSSGNIYPIEKETLIRDSVNSEFKINAAPYLGYDNVDSFTGTWKVWRAGGAPGKDGKDGTVGTDGADGDSAYQIWLDAGNSGTEQDFLTSLEGQSAYQLWISKGNSGTEQDFLNSLKGINGKDGINGTDGTNGASAYQIWLSQGNTGTEQDFLNSLKGDTGGAFALEVVNEIPASPVAATLYIILEA